MENQPSKTNRLRSVPGQRRTVHRTEGFDPIPVTVKFNSGTYLEARLDCVDYGRVVLSLNDAAWKTMTPTTAPLVDRILDANGEIILDGGWNVRRLRSDGKRTVFVAEHPDAEFLGALDSFVTPDTFLRSNQHRLFSLQKADDVERVSRFFTDLKDCPVAASGFLRDGVHRVPFHFDFTSGKRSLETIDMKVRTSQVSNLKPKTRWTADFCFLAVRYLLPVTIQSYDKDWHLLEMRMDHFLLAVTNRIHDRHACRIQVTIDVGASSEPVKATITEINGQGGLIRFEDKNSPEHYLGRDFTFTPSPDADRFRAIGVRSFDERLAFHFIKGGNERVEPLSRLVFSHLEEPVTTRRPENYEEFIKLYASVGYAPTDPSALIAWKEETKRTWNKTDETIPHTCLGYTAPDGSIACSMGTLPWGPEMVYGHSFAMARDLHGALGTLDQLILSFAWMEIIPKIKHYGGAVSQNARWTTKLQSNFACQPAPSGRIVINVRKYAFDNVELRSENELNLIDIGKDWKSWLTAFSNINLVVSLMHDAHPLVKGIHDVRVFGVGQKGGDSFSIIIQNSAPSYFTGFNLLRRTWVFNIGTKIDVRDIVAALRRHSGPLTGPIMYVTGDGSGLAGELDLKIDQEPLLYMFTPREELGALAGSIARASYHLVRKYSTAETNYLSRFVKSSE